MRNNLYRYAIIFVSIVMLSGCSSKTVRSDEVPTNTERARNDVIFDESPAPLEETPYSGAIEEFILSIKNNDAESLKQIVSPSGLIVIRNFGSGFGTRGKDIRNLYAMDEIPDNLQFAVSGEKPVTLHDLFTESQQCEVSDIPVTKINDRYFNFTDDVETENYGPLTEDVRDLCSELTSDYSPRVFELGEKEVVLTESSLDGLVGVWAVFERHNDQYLLRAVIDLR